MKLDDHYSVSVLDGWLMRLPKVQVQGSFPYPFDQGQALAIQMNSFFLCLVVK
jgi:hypothetical protein